MYSLLKSPAGPLLLSGSAVMYWLEGNGSKTLLSGLLFASFCGWLIMLITYRNYMRRYRYAIFQWVKPLIFGFYFFFAANAVNIGWAFVLTVLSLDDPPKSRVISVFFSQFSVCVLSALLPMYYKRLPGYLNRLKIHKQNSDRFKAITNSFHDSIIEIDNQSLIWYSNPAAYTVFGYTDEQGNPLEFPLLITDLMPPRFRDHHTQGMKRFLETGNGILMNRKEPIEMIGLKKDGTEFPIEITLSHYHIGESVRFTAIIRDISKRKRLEAGE